ncbi:ABC transporter substrate-binding protein [Paenibacillus odorifer]|uniref:ABC transporter substrate-binding protein n=2 Tax=Paenibacillus odorifer TaxID=189426 RepID=UPI00096D1BB5|nr:extracellular solute-binding protein [Paenibacillus odorifer]OMD66580.1 ABC transporter substrate-binding protein [Paenibacillus odorifer]
MKKKVFKVIPGLLLSTALVFAGCSSGNNESGSSESGSDSSSGAAKPATLKVMMFGDKPADMDKILAEYESRSKAELNTKLEIEFNPSADHKQKLGLKMAAGEEVDLAFDAGFLSLNQNISNGFYQELDKYFNNDEYPGLKKAFPPELVKANQTNGKLYVIPLTQYYYDVDCIFIRKDLREKYGLEPIQSYDDLKVYLDKVQENDSSLIPMALRGERGFYKLFENEIKQTGFRVSLGGAGAPFSLVLSEDGTKVLNAVTFGDPQSLYDSFPAPFNQQFYFEQPYDKYVEFSKYLEKDVLVQKDPQSLFVSGKAALNEGTLSGFSSIQEKLKSGVPGAELEVFIYNSKVREMQPEAIGVTYKANNNMVIPVTSKNADRTMKFLDWVYSSQDNHDLFELGIEGEHWEKDGDAGFKPLDGLKNYNFPSYQLTLNSLMSRVNTNNDANVLEYLNYSAQANTYYKIPLAGFSFNSEPVKTEVAKLSSKYLEYYPLMKNGLDPDWRESMTKLNKELSALGLEKVRTELVKQAQEYLDNGGE